MKKFILTIMLILLGVIVILVGVMYISDGDASDDLNQYLCDVQEDFGSESHIHLKLNGSFTCNR